MNLVEAGGEVQLAAIILQSERDKASVNQALNNFSVDMLANKNRYWRPITLRFDDGTEASFEVDLPTWKAIFEDKDQSMIEKLVKITRKLNLKQEVLESEAGSTRIQELYQTRTQQPCTDQSDPSAEDKDSIAWKHEYTLMLLSSYEDPKDLLSNSAFKSTSA
ncbi:hypothetical protein MAR_009085 [Mya arenaria]|uniref:Uncharacterized protein n=1 Tax=Mya arenaria TaxID=6604 RepID=A0ABY7DXQ3_MYAAR|nr:hypothetical protein MAR_009085 [Mya arenaria]